MYWYARKGWLNSWNQKLNSQKRSAESIEGSGESWKEGFIRLRHESDAKLKLLTQKITKKKAKEDSKSLKSQLAFATGYVKPPKGIRAAQLKVVYN